MNSSESGKKVTDTIYQKEANWKRKKITSEFRTIYRLFEMLPHTRCVLDIGCAEGFICWMARDAGIDSVTGIDVEPVRIHKAKKYSNGVFYCGSIFDHFQKINDADVFIASRFLHNIKWEKTRELMTEICKKKNFLMIIKYKTGTMKETGKARSGLALKSGIKKLCKEFNLDHKSFPSEVIVAAKGKDVAILQKMADKYGTK